MEKWNSKELSKHLAILTQSNQIQMKLTVEELVAFGRFPHSDGRMAKEDEEKIDQAITYMELDEFRNRFIDELSEDRDNVRISQWLSHRIQSLFCWMNLPIILIFIMQQI